MIYNAIIVLVFFIVIFLMAIKWDKIVWFVVPTTTLGFSLFLWPLLYTGFAFKLTWFVVIPTLVHMCAFMFNRKAINFRPDWVLITLLALFTSYLFASISWSSNPDYGFTKTTLFTARVVLPAIVLLTAASNSFSCSGLGYSLQFQGIYLIISLLFFHTTELGRLTLPNLNPIWIARFAILAIAASLWNLSRFSGIKKILLNGVIIAACMNVVLATGSRGPTLAFILAMISVGAISIFQNKAAKKIKTILALATAILFIMLLGYFMLQLYPDMADRFIGLFSDRDSLESGKGFGGRGEFLRLAYSMFMQNMLFGKGIGGYADFWHDYPHNLIAELAAETGIVGVLTLFAIILYILFLTLRAHKGSPGPLIIFLTALFFALFSGDMTSNYEWGIIGAFVVSCNGRQGKT